MSPRESAVLQLVHAHHSQAEEGHKRLRVDWREHEERLIELERLTRQTEGRLAALIATPPDLAKTKLSAGTVVTIVFAVVGIIAGQLAATYGIRSDVRDNNTRMEERSNALKSAVEAIARKQELQQIQIQELREAVLGQSRKGR